MTDSARNGAYADLVGGLLDARPDPATERFDTELATAVAHGTLTPETARILRFWQRASLRGLVEHARTVVPAALEALDAARAESSVTVEAEAQSWRRATSADGEEGEPGRARTDPAPTDTAPLEEAPPEEAPTETPLTDSPLTDSAPPDSAPPEAAPPDLPDPGNAQVEDVARPPEQVDLTTRRSRLIVAGLTQVTIGGEAPAP